MRIRWLDNRHPPVSPRAPGFVSCGRFVRRPRDLLTGSFPLRDNRAKPGPSRDNGPYTRSTPKRQLKCNLQSHDRATKSASKGRQQSGVRCLGTALWHGAACCVWCGRTRRGRRPAIWAFETGACRVLLSPPRGASSALPQSGAKAPHSRLSPARTTLSQTSAISHSLPIDRSCFGSLPRQRLRSPARSRASLPFLYPYPYPYVAALPPAKSPAPPPARPPHLPPALLPALPPAPPPRSPLKPLHFPPAKALASKSPAPPPLKISHSPETLSQKAKSPENPPKKYRKPPGTRRQDRKRTSIFIKCRPRDDSALALDSHRVNFAARRMVHGALSFCPSSFCRSQKRAPADPRRFSKAAMQERQINDGQNDRAL